MSLRPLALLVACGIVSLVGAATAATGPSGTIAFTAGDGIDTIEADGSQHANVMNVAADPAWSSDGRQIAFTSIRDGWEAIYIANADGAGVRRLTPTSLRALSPVWAGDGRIAFWAQAVPGTVGPAGIFVTNADGSGLHQVLADGGATQPSWSPDGTQIAFTDLRGYGPGVASVDVMHADGTDVTRIAVGEAPAWSPDGKQLAYIGVDANHQRQLVVAAPDGNASGARPIAAVGSCRLAQAPAWSPDGRWLAFESCPNGTLVELYLIPSAGGRPIRIALNASVDGGPDWQPVKPSTGIVARFIFAQRACATQPGRATVTVADAQNRPLAAATVTITGGVRIKPAHGVTNANGRAVLALRAVLHRPHRLTLTARVTASGRPALDRRLTLPACSS